MPTRLISIDDPALDLATAKLHLRVDHDEENALISGLIAAATSLAAQHTGRSIARCTWDLKLDAFPPSCIRLLWPPVIALTSIQYLDVGGTPQALSAAQYQLDTHSEPARLLPALGASWPATAPLPNAVTVRYTAGYGAACPDAIRQWILLQIGHGYENRASVNVGNIVNEMPYVDSLLDAYRIW